MAYKNNYHHIISFGCMCSCSLFLQKNGFRDASYFFDWLTSDFFNNIEVIKSDFADVLNPKYFIQEYSDYPHLVTHTKYHFVYTHVFNAKQTYEKQCKRINKYVTKRIENFKSVLSDETLLVYYCRDKDEQKRIVSSSKSIFEFASAFNVEIIFIFNNPVDSLFPFEAFVIPSNNIHHPIGGEVSYPFEGGDIDNLIQWITQRYDANKISQNLKHKTKRNLIKALFRKLSRNKKDILKF